MTRNRLAASLIALAIALPVLPARADEALIERWYAALRAADRDALSNLLADNAQIRLDDLGVTQSKAEFIASMDEWQGAAAGASIRHRIQGVEGDLSTVLVCYDFPDNDLLMQERFAVSSNRIVASTQAAVAESCESF